MQAADTQVILRFLRETLGAVALGTGGGLVVATATTRLLGAFLFAISPLDLPAFTTATAILATVALLAAWLPARRATRNNPMLVMRRTGA